MSTKSPSMKLMKKNAKAEAVAEEAKAAEVETTEVEQEDELAKPAKTKAKATKAKTTKAKAKKEVAEEVVEGEDMIADTAAEVENLTQSKATKMVPELLDNIDKDYFKLGGVLSVIQYNGWFQDGGYENFRAYVEAECSIQYRKAMYLISIYNGLVESGVAWNKVKHLGWTKLKELSGILTTENVDEWVEYAEAMTVLQLQEHIKIQSKGSSEEENPEVSEDVKKTTTMTFKLHEDQKDTVNEALEKAKHETGTDVATAALEFIALDYLGGSKLKHQPTLKELMEGKTAVEVLTIFGEVFPEVEIEATLPEEDEE